VTQAGRGGTVNRVANMVLTVAMALVIADVAWALDIEVVMVHYPPLHDPQPNLGWGTIYSM